MTVRGTRPATPAAPPPKSHYTLAEHQVELNGLARRMEAEQQAALQSLRMECEALKTRVAEIEAAAGDAGKRRAK